MDTKNDRRRRFATNFPVQPQPRKHQVRIDNYLVLDSRDRDRTVWADTNEFALKLNELRNVVQVKLVSCIFPSTGVTGGYLNLQIAELDAPHSAGGRVSADRQRMFAMLPLKDATDGYYHIDEHYDNRKIYQRRPKEQLSTWTVRIRMPDGTLAPFGTDTSEPTAPNESIQVSLRLRVTTLEYRANPFFGDLRHGTVAFTPSSSSSS